MELLRTSIHADLFSDAMRCDRRRARLLREMNTFLAGLK